jgi:hypothetical protein
MGRFGTQGMEPIPMSRISVSTIISKIEERVNLLAAEGEGLLAELEDIRWPDSRPEATEARVRTGGRVNREATRHVDA